MHLRGPRSQAIWLFLGCVALFAATNFLTFQLMLVPAQNMVIPVILICVCYSSIGAQMALHAIWCVLAPLDWIKRFLVGAASGLVLYGALALGVAIYLSHFGGLADVGDMLSFVTGLLCLPLLLLAAQTPLWIMRIWFKSRLNKVYTEKSFGWHMKHK